MIALAVDENFDLHILRALRRRVPALDARSVIAAGLDGADDAKVLAWAALEGRVLLTHDVRTVPRFAFERVTRGEPMPGVIEVSSRASLRQALDDLELLVICSTPDDHRDRVVYVPLR